MNERDTFRWDEPEEKRYFICVCQDCGWESELVDDRDDLTMEECPECKGTYLLDEKVWA